MLKFLNTSTNRFCRKHDLKELPGKAWLAVHDYQQNLFDELSIDIKKTDPKVAIYGDLVYKEGSAPTTFWHRTILEKPFIAEFKTIREASDILRSIQRNWAHYPVACFRRAELIKEKLPFINEKPRPFPYSVPHSPMGMWSLIDENTLFASAVTSSPFACGEIHFEEDHINPPSRAYQKLREALTWAGYFNELEIAEGESSIPIGRYNKEQISIPTGRYNNTSNSVPNGKYNTTSNSIPTGRYINNLPGPGSRCIDAGACPGGWTWVLDGLGATVTAIDRSPLDPRLMAKPNITFIKHDAFTLKPSEFGEQDWVFSDVICYPPRQLEWAKEWIDSGLCKNMICTIKMQGNADHETTRAFASIPGSHVIHLSANKNELTWIWKK